MSLRYAKQIGVELKELPYESLVYADVRKGKVYQTVNNISLRVGNTYQETFAFTVTSLQYDIILGLPWLEDHLVNIDWKKYTLSFKMDGQAIVLRARRARLEKDDNLSSKIINSIVVRRLRKKGVPVFAIHLKEISLPRRDVEGKERLASLFASF